jgi:hypothetical protein
MAWQADPLLLEVFEALHGELSSALEASEWLTDTPANASDPITRATALRKIATLRMLLAEMQAALERRPSAIVH